MQRQPAAKRFADERKPDLNAQKLNAPAIPFPDQRIGLSSR